MKLMAGATKLMGRGYEMDGGGVYEIDSREAMKLMGEGL